jgi:hypothetical protein
MTVNTTEQAVQKRNKDHRTGYFGFLKDELGEKSAAMAIQDYVRGDGKMDMKGLIETFQNTRIDPNIIDKGLEAAGVPARARQNISEALRKINARKGRIAAKQPETAGQKLLKGLLSRPTTFQGEPTEAEDYYTALSKAIKANQKSRQQSGIAYDDLPPISRSS